MDRIISAAGLLPTSKLSAQRPSGAANWSALTPAPTWPEIVIVSALAGVALAQRQARNAGMHFDAFLVGSRSFPPHQLERKKTRGSAQIRKSAFPATARATFRNSLRQTTLRMVSISAQARALHAREKSRNF